ncbi:MAG TPA: Holliday junction branch migration protein RuvA [Anaerolineales bacterium]|nr:Holliday junction branch migration protein RuvA [Anaerolineales bacterium]
MIATIRGVVQHVGIGEAVVEVGGVGLRVSVPRAVLESGMVVGKVVFLHTYLVVREDALSLYGFESPEQREVFDALLQVSGVGPKLAMAVLSHMNADALRSAVASGQPEALDRVPGVGKKTAERIVFHLKDRFAAAEAVSPQLLAADTDVLAALTALGYSLVEAQAAVQSLPPDGPEEVEARVRLALRYFARP